MRSFVIPTLSEPKGKNLCSGETCCMGFFVAYGLAPQNDSLRGIAQFRANLATREARGMFFEPRGEFGFGKSTGSKSHHHRVCLLLMSS
jgi:hypothetical protein